MRELERRYNESGSLEDEAAWLAARLRAGEVSLDRVRAAARLGHEASRRRLAELGEDVSIYLEDWLEDLEAEVQGRVLVAAVRRAVERLDQLEEATPRHYDAVRAFEQWLLCPCERHVDDARVAILGVDGGGRYGRERMRWLVTTVFEHGANALQWLGHPRPHEHRVEATSNLTTAVYQASKLGSGLRDDVRREVIPWCLGLRDPVEARRQRGD